MSWRVRMQLVAGLVLLLLSVGINGRGALARETWTWNVRPTNVDDYPGKIWDWRQPQFLAGWVHPPKPAAPLLTSERVDFATSQADPFLWFGWSAPDPASRWTEEKQAGIVFRIVPQYVSTGGVLKMQLSPFLDSGKVSSQQVIVRLNRTQIADFRLDHSEPSEIAVTMPPRLLNETNEMVFELPDARSPLSVGISKDPRDLGIAVFWIQLQPQ